MQIHLNLLFIVEISLKKRGIIINLDINIIWKPKINKYVTKMISQIAKLLKIKTRTISIKATTNEKIGFIGNGQE